MMRVVWYDVDAFLYVERKSMNSECLLDPNRPLPADVEMLIHLASKLASVSV